MSVFPTLLCTLLSSFPVLVLGRVVLEMEGLHVVVDIREQYQASNANDSHHLEEYLFHQIQLRRCKLTNESNAQCELKVKAFMKSQLKLSDDVVDNMQFEGCQRLAVFANRRRRVVYHQQNRSIIVRFRNNADKSLVWGAKSHITDHHISISDNYCADTEYKRNRLYMIYKKAKSLGKFKQKTSLSGEVLVIDGSHYTVEDLHNLPDELNIRQFSEKVNNDFYVFGGIHSSANPFSN